MSSRREYRPLALSLLALSSMPALAEEPVVTEPVLKEPVHVLETVEVKATALSDFKTESLSSTKYTAPLLNTAKSVTVIPAKVLEQTAATSLTEALRMTPGITLGAGEGGNPIGDRPFIRGYDTQSSTFIDGVRDLGSTSREVFDLEQIEVVKGPNGAVDGRGAPGGSINLVSKSPKLQNFNNATLGLGTDNYKRATVDSNVKLSEGTAFRINGMYMDADVAGRNEVTNSRWGFAPSIAFGLNTDTRVNLSYYHMETDDLPDGGAPYNNPFGPTSPNVGLNGDGRPVKMDRELFFGLVNRDFRETSSDIVTVAIEHDLNDEALLKNTTRFNHSTHAYIWTQPDDSKGNFLLYDTLWRRINSRDSRLDTLTNQTDISGSFTWLDMKHSYATGVEFSGDLGKRDGYTVATDSDPNTAGNNTNCPASLLGVAGNYNCTSFTNPNPYDPWNGSITKNNRPTDTRTLNASVYAFDTVELNEQWLVSGGLRWDSYSTQVSSIDTTATSPTYNREVTIKADDTFINYQFGVVYKPLPNGSIYLSYGMSSIPVGAVMGEGTEGQSLSALTRELDPEENTSFELGTKWDVFAERAALTASIFKMETDNARITQADGTAAMAGNKQVEGVEVGLTGNITDAWEIMAGYTYLNSELVKAGGSGAANGVQDGNEFPNTPEKSYSLWTNYTINSKFSVGAGAFYMDEVWGNTANTKWVPAYTRFDAVANYVINPNASLQLNIQNLTDEYYYDKAYSSHYANIAPGRSATVTLNIKY